MRRPAQFRLQFTALAALTVLTVAGCSSSSKQATTVANTPTTALATPATAPPVTAKPPTGDPIKIGYINNEGGAAFSVPELRIGAQVGADYVNKTLGGVNNHPVQIVPCADDGSPEKSIDCANKLVEAKVAAVMVGTDLGADALLPILKAAHIPLVGHIQLGAGQMFDPNAYFFGAAALSYGGAALKFYADQGAKSVEWFIPDQPALHALADALLAPAATKLGMKYKSIFYDAASPNWSVLAATAVSDRPDVSGSIVGTDGPCAGFIGALRDAGYQGHILAASCNGLFKAVGDKAVGVDTDADHWNPSDPLSAPAAKQLEITAYADAMKAASHSDLVNGNAVIGFADVVDLAKILSTAQDPIAGPAVSAALMATKGFDSFIGPTITCDHSVLKGNSACSNGLLFFRIQKDGSPKAVTAAFVTG